MRWLGLGLGLVLCCFNSSAEAAPRQIRLSLDDRAAPSEPRVLTPHGDFALTPNDQPPMRAGRLIRLSLDDGVTAYGRLTHPAASGRRIRTRLD